MPPLRTPAGRSARSYHPVELPCKHVGCFYRAKVMYDLLRHEGFKHATCSAVDCEGRYTVGERDTHHRRVHGAAARKSESFQCRHIACLWSTEDLRSRRLHEEEGHVRCKAARCDVRSTRALHNTHVRQDHGEEEVYLVPVMRQVSLPPIHRASSYSSRWTIAEQAVLDYLWQVVGNFSDISILLPKLFPDRMSAVNPKMLKNLRVYIETHRHRYEHMEQLWTGSILDEHLTERGIIRAGLKEEYNRGSNED